MLLAVDVGNTNIVAGVFRGEDLVADFRLRTEARATGDELGLALVGLLGQRGIAATDISGVVVSNVVPSLSRSLDDVASRAFGHRPLVVGPGVRTGMRILYDDPRQVGADRIVNAIAAHRRYGGPAILVDLGTATTLDAIAENGDYVGGAIAPGMEVSLEALVSHTAKLSRVEPTAPPTVIGKNTVASMQSGLVYGYVGLIEGLIERMTIEIGGRCRVVATGGLAELIAALTPRIEVVDQRLTLDGLRLVWELNNEA